MLKFIAIDKYITLSRITNYKYAQVVVVLYGSEFVPVTKYGIKLSLEEKGIREMKTN